MLAFILGPLAGSIIRVNNQWEEAIILRLGKYKKTVGPGIFKRLPVIDSIITRDTRIRTLDIPRQEVITKDNISVGVDAVVFLRVSDTKKSIVNIQDFVYAVNKYSQTTLRNVVGEKSLDEVLEKREEIAKSIKTIVDKQAEKWGIDITGIELQNIELPPDMKRVMARQAEAEREKRAVIIKSEGEVVASKNLKKAANTLMESKKGVAVRLRELSTLADISYDQSNTIVFYPIGLGSDMLLAGTALSKRKK
ncbi:MAG: slipin family protein [Candidatus Aenigmarchaeota archaeon]|nr:slipin family protein [Candidatus Aenigmarchaeota archaeon]